MKLTEPSPLWPEAPRYCPARPLPPYRFVPGLNPHPTGRPEGHSYGVPEAELSYLPPERWPENETYLFGIDLYHQGYFWEAHEAWEQLWHLTQKSDVEGQFLQGIIQNTAAQLKLHIKNLPGTSHLSREAYRRLSFAFDKAPLDAHGCYLGLNLAQLLDAMVEHYGPLWEGSQKIVAPPPRLRLCFSESR